MVGRSERGSHKVSLPRVTTVVSMTVSSEGSCSWIGLRV